MDSALSQQHRIGRPPTCVCGECGKCKKAAYMRGWYAKRTLEQRRESVRSRDPEAVERADRNRKRPDYHRERERVRLQTRRAVASGKIEKGNCARCASPLVHAHHEDYTKPLEVIWLCPYHHSERHRERAQEAGF